MENVLKPKNLAALKKNPTVTRLMNVFLKVKLAVKLKKRIAMEIAFQLKTIAAQKAKFTAHMMMKSHATQKIKSTYVAQKELHTVNSLKDAHLSQIAVILKMVKSSAMKTTHVCQLKNIAQNVKRRTGVVILVLVRNALKISKNAVRTNSALMKKEINTVVKMKSIVRPKAKSIAKVKILMVTVSEIKNNAVLSNQCTTIMVSAAQVKTVAQVKTKHSMKKLELVLTSVTVKDVANSTAVMN